MPAIPKLSPEPTLLATLDAKARQLKRRHLLDVLAHGSGERDGRRSHLSQEFFYCQDIPGYDGWGYGFEYYLNVEHLLGANVMAIRSAGRDGVFSSTDYPIGPFLATQYDTDLVWADGLFISYPAGVATATKFQAAP